MNYVSLEDITTIQQSKTLEFLNNDGTDSQTISQSIKNFNSNSQNHLKGDVWDKERAKYAVYDEALSKHSSIANEMASTIQSIISELQAAMNGYDSIDISKLDEIKDQKRACEANIDSIRSKMNQKRFNLKTFSFEPVYDNAALQVQLNAELQVLAELEKLITTIEIIKAICDKGEAKLNSLLNEMSAIAAGIESITPSEAVAV